NTGYRGRIGLFEIMAINDALRSTILQTQDAKQIDSQARAQGMTTLRQDGIQKVINGDTTMEDMLRVTQI
ncbi:unnamed protein product, partial [marine sediment metagenome]